MSGNRANVCGLGVSVLALCALCALGACAASDDTAPAAMADPCTPVALVAAAGTSDADKAALGDAAALWGAVARLDLRVGNDSNGDGGSDGAGGSSAATATVIPVRFAPAALAFLGAYEPDRRDVVVNSEIPDEPTRAVVLAHELGHAFGMAHISGRPSVMNAGNSTVSPNAGDADALAVLWGSCAR